jgi:uncharacterized protein (DUF58 family)
MFLKDVQGISNLSFLAQKAMQGFITGLHNSPLKGFSVEFAEHRFYNTGESVKNLDWKLLARTEKKYVKQFIEETNLKAHIWLDVSGSMAFPHPQQSKLKLGLLLASTLGFILNKQRDAFSIQFFESDKILWRSDLKSTKSHLNHCLFFLEKLWTDGLNIQARSSEKPNELGLDSILPINTNPISISESLQHLGRRNLVVICSDCLWNSDQKNEEVEFWNCLNYMRFKKAEVLLIHIADQEKEENFSISDSPIRFQDLETQQEIRLNPAEYKQLYIENEAKRIQKIKENCYQNGIGYFNADVSQPLETALFAFYKQRNKLV